MPGSFVMVFKAFELASLVAERRLLEPSPHARIHDTGVHGKQGNHRRGERPSDGGDTPSPQHSTPLSPYNDESFAYTFSGLTSLEVLG